VIGEGVVEMVTLVVVVDAVPEAPFDQWSGSSIAALHEVISQDDA
jgi:hypothetical protein